MLGGILGLLLGCASRPPKSAVVPLAPTSDETFLIEDGKSSQASFSPHGDRLIYISELRTQHLHPQVYERDLNLGTDYRLTYQNGSCLTPHYHPIQDWVLYASTTDELKENPPLLNPVSSPSFLPAQYQTPSEIYIHARTGLEITRVSDHIGYDGEAHFSQDGRKIYWTRAIPPKRLTVVELDRTTKQLRILPGLGVNPSQYIRRDKQGLTAWVDWGEDFTRPKIQLKLNQNPAWEINSQFEVTKLDLNMSVDGRFLFWSQRNAIHEKFEIWYYDISLKCAHMLTGDDSADRRYPELSPDGTTLIYTWVQGERSKVAARPFNPASGPCETGP